MSIYNGASTNNVDDLLQTIRSSLNEEAASRPLNGEIQVPYPRREPAREAGRETPIAEEASEFELPAIFKPGHSMQPEKPKLFGRLSDALKSPAASEADRSRTVIRFEPAGGRMIEPPPQAARPQTQTKASGAEAPQNPPQAGPDPNVKREMPSFFDQRLNKLGEMTRQAYSPKPEPKPVAQPQQSAPPPLKNPQLINSAHAAQHTANLQVEDAAAQLLRPMLRQWLSENMPKIVEKALLSEVEGAIDPDKRK